MTLTKEQRRFALGIGALLVALYIVPIAIGIAAKIVDTLHPNPRVASSYTKPSPATPMSSNSPYPPGSTFTGTPTIAPNDEYAKMIGVWQGTSVQPNRGICTLRVEIRMSNAVPDGYAGYSTMRCNPSFFTIDKDRRLPNSETLLAAQVEPVSAILSGMGANDAIQFHVDRNIGQYADGCKPTSFTISPFGLQQIAAQWQEGNCRSGDMILRRA